MHAVPDLIRPWVPREYTTLGADGFGFSDTRAAARRYYNIDGPPSPLPCCSSWPTKARSPVSGLSKLPSGIAWMMLRRDLWETGDDEVSALDLR